MDLVDALQRSSMGGAAFRHRGPAGGMAPIRRPMTSCSDEEVSVNTQYHARTASRPRWFSSGLHMDSRG